MNTDTIPNVEEITDLLGKLVGRHEGDSILLHILIALLEDKGVLAPGEVDAAVGRFLRERGHEHFVEQWGDDLGGGMYEGMALSQLQ
ncbi:MAG: hypothetical protein PVSMB4_11750 [Ktedonobacterales bacterium]